MKRVLVLAIIMLAIFFIPITTADSPIQTYDAKNSQQGLSHAVSLSSASSKGNEMISSAQYTREIQGLDFSLMNSYSDTSSHLRAIDFSIYHIAGWSLYEVQILPSRIVALAEKEIVGTSSNPSYFDFKINETGIGTGKYYNQLAQGFYNQAYNGKLENISLLYDCRYYDPSHQNYAYFDIRSDYQDGSTNIVSSVPLENVGLTRTWANVTESVFLNADTTYYAVMNGTKLQEYFDIYPEIRWMYQNTAGSFLTRRYSTEFSAWSSDRPFEALLNYTYIPWNTTRNLALEFQNPQGISLQGNSSSLSGTEWLFTSTSNVSQIQFSSNQSVSIEYDLILRYKQDITSTTTWFAGSSGTSVTWNITSVLDFPELGGLQEKSLTLVMPNDWTANHLFNLTSPTQNYDHFTQNGAIVECTLLGDETWVLECTSPNYLQAISKFDSSDDSTINDRVLASVTMDINSTIESPASEPATNGEARLRVLHQGSIQYSENVSVVSGTSYHQWDISSHSSSNGLYIIDIFWMNGTEAGYRTTEVLVYYQTSLVADENSIDAFTDSSFYIGVDFNQVFPVGGIDAAAANVTYSFGAVANQSLNDQSNGRWDTTVSTASMAPATYDLHIYAEGYALENKSLVIQVTLIHDTETLVIAWSNTNDITYTGTTELTVYYNRVTGSAPIPGATVNVTIDSNTWVLKWDGINAYRITFNGTDTQPGFGFHNLMIEAWKEGYKPQNDSTQTLSLQEEPTTLTLQWSNSNDITYIESTTLSANYTMSGGFPVLGAFVNVTIGTDTWNMTWNSATETYDYVFDGTANPPSFGLHNLTVEAGNFGYVYRVNSSLSLKLSEEPTSLVLSWSSGFDITYVEETYLIANYTMSNGSAVTGATLNVTIGTDYWELSWHAPSQTYRILFNGSDSPPGFGVHSVTVKADLFGFVSKIDSSETLTISEEPTSLVLSWSAGNHITYIEQTTLSAAYRMSNGSAVRDASVNITIGQDKWQLVWYEGSQTYRVTFSGADTVPGIGIHDLVVEAALFGYVSKFNTTEQLIISEEPTTLTINWSNGFTITYIEQTTLSVWYNMSDGTPITDATVTVTIGGNLWTLDWNPLSEAYETTFSGTDNPPGFGTHSIIIEASKVGFESRYDDSRSLVINLEPTSLQLQWWVSDTITYVGQTVLYANFTMSNGSAVLGAYVTTVIGSANKTFEWNPFSKVYSLVLSGSDPAYLLGSHMVSVQATLFGYEQRNDNTQTLTVQNEPTTMTPSWSPDNNITYFESTILSIRYDMSNGTSIPDATVNITIGSDVWVLTWNPLSESYVIELSGSDNRPGYGTHDIVLRASKYGYNPIIDSSLQLIIRLEDTKISFEWAPSDTITYVEQTKLRIFYLLSNGTPITGATVNITRASTTWLAVWNSTSQSYEYVWHGNDDPPGIGSFLLLIKAWKANYVGIIDVSQTLTINKEPTQIHIGWSNGNNITYVQTTKLLVNYTTASGVVIPDAQVTVIVEAESLPLTWNSASHLYEIIFSGSDDPPGLGSHALSVTGLKSGFEIAVNSSETLTLRVEPTTLTPSWMPLDTITYVEMTTLSVRYEMSNGDPISGANVNVTIGVDVWILTWNPISEAYEVTFSGSDSPPGLGVHSLTIEASRWGFQNASNPLETLTIVGEPTSFVISWLEGNNITYVKGTTLSVRYQMSNASSIPSAEVNVTINGFTWTLIWNQTSEAYERFFAGSDDPPGYGTHIVEIAADKFGYESIFDSSQRFTIRVEDTYFSFDWQPSSTITYVESTKIRIYYRMSNGTPIEGATVNATGATIWIAAWNSTSQAYEILFLGTDDPPGLGSHQLTIQAWKVNYAANTDSSQIITINEEPTQIHASWSNGNSISFTETTTLLVEYISSHGIIIPLANVNVTVGTDLWPLMWNSTSQLYEIAFSNGTSVWPGLGTYGLTIKAKQFGYENAINISQTLTINSEQVKISSVLFGGSTITYIGSTLLVVNYTTLAGVAVAGATVNVTIDETLWDLKWDPGSETYRIRFNGSDSLPGFGIHNLIINASSLGFDALTDSSKFLTIIEEPTSLNIFWGAPNFSNVTYFDYTILYAEYKMGNGTIIKDATVNVTIGTATWFLEWNSTQMAYSLRFNGSDEPPGLGTHSMTVEAGKYGYVSLVNNTITLILSKDPTTLEISWTNGNDISYIEKSTLSVVYKMSNGSDISDILGGLVSATIGSDVWVLTWNGTAGTYQVQFTGDQNPPGFGSFLVVIHASADVFAAQVDYTSLTIHTESTTATPSWSAVTIDWTQSAIFSVDLRDSYGSLVDGATVKSIYINGTEYELLGTNGTYWMEFNNTFDLGLHSVWANIGKFGYESASVLSISFTIIQAPTNLSILWSSSTIDFLGQADLTVDYYYTGTGSSVPSAGVIANITIDGTRTIRLNLQGDYWIAALYGDDLDLGVHNVVIQAWVYGYEFSETSDSLTVNEVSTNPLLVGWNPTNLTIEYTDHFDLTVDYTYYAGDVPGSAMVNVTVGAKLYTLVYSGDLWSTSIPGAELGIGLHTATVSAWLYGYVLQTDITTDLNITLAANSFVVTWEPSTLNATYTDVVNVSVVYTQDYAPILDSTVQLMINNTPYLMSFNGIDEVWTFSTRARDIGLGIWNVTVTANKTGYAEGWDSRILTISLASSNLTILPDPESATSIYYDENVTFDVYYQLLNTSIIPGAVLTFEVNGTAQTATWNIDHWTYTSSGEGLGVGIHTFYVLVTAYGFKSATESFDFTVNAIPTSVTTPSTTITIFAHESFSFSVTWVDEKNSVAIPGYIPEVIWPDSFSVVDHGKGNYSIQANSNGLHIGTYELQVNFTRTGYENGTCLLSIKIMELPIVLIYDNTIEQYENESIIVDVEMFDGPHAVVIDWGEIILELEGVQHILIYNSVSELYSVEIWLSTLSPGNYSLNFTASATDCETDTGIIQLKIMPKTTYELTLEVSEEVKTGQQLQITVLAISEADGASGLSITVHIVIERRNKAPQVLTDDITTMSDGLASLELAVPNDATSLTIWAEFEGSISEWSAISDTVYRETLPGGFDILAFIFSLFSNPVTLVIFVGIIGGPIAGVLLFRRRHRIPTSSSPSIMEPTISHPTPVPPPLGELELIQDLIKKSPAGLTRAQIAEALEISTSKAGALVRKLLTSASGFEEIKEGRLSRIKFRG